MEAIPLVLGSLMRLACIKMILLINRISSVLEIGRNMNSCSPNMLFNAILFSALYLDEEASS